MHTCFALLDDAHSSDACSRLYTDLVTILASHSPAEWDAMLHEVQQATARGLHTVALLDYESGMQLQGLPTTAPANSRIALFSHCARMTAAEVAQWLEAHGSAQAAGIADLRSSVDETAFTQAIHRVRDYIAAGDTYQVNYTYRLHFSAYGSPLDLYRRLRARQPVPYGALIVLPDGEAVVSLSPELFVRHEKGKLLARPMKGTAPASVDAEENMHRAAALSADSKNRAENLMIVDLLRNDLGRIACTGSVQVSHLFSVRPFASVLQMTSDVEATLAPGMTLNRVMRAIYPCGSITGAPKLRTMEIIAELESTPRDLYTGAIGWFDPVADPQQLPDFCLNVAIRTLHLQTPDTHGWRAGSLGVGAGIVYDSEAAQEYAECQLKARFLTGLTPTFGLLETMRCETDGCVSNLELHLQRLTRSAQFFGIPLDLEKVRERLANLQRAQPSGQVHRLRLCLQSDGSIDLQSAPLLPLPAQNFVMLSDEIIASGHPFSAHKTTLRERYDHAWQEAQTHGAFDQLFCNEHGHLCEGGRSNLFVQIDGKWMTPPLSDGLLPGVMRGVLLDRWHAEERSLTPDDLRRAERIVLCNALRGAMEVRLLA